MSKIIIIALLMGIILGIVAILYFYGWPKYCDTNTAPDCPKYCIFKFESGIESNGIEWWGGSCVPKK